LRLIESTVPYTILAVLNPRSREVFPFFINFHIFPFILLK